MFINTQIVIYYYVYRVNIMKFVFKNFLNHIRKFKSSAVINIIGLAAAFVVFIFVIMQARYDFTFNRSFEKSDNIYLFSGYSDIKDGWMPSLTDKFATDLYNTFPEIKNFSLYYVSNDNNYELVNNNGDKERFKYSTCLVTSGFASVFTPEIIAGSAEDVMTSPGKVMIPESFARKFFGKNDPIGQVLTNNSFSGTKYDIGAVYKDFPKNSTIDNGVYVVREMDMNSQSSTLPFFEIATADIPSVLAKLNDPNNEYTKIIKQAIYGEDESIRIRLVSMPELPTTVPGRYLRSKAVNLNQTYALLAIGIVILIIAFTNYINFAVAMIPSRIKTLNIHKILGVDQNFMRLTIAAEGVFISLAAMLIAIVSIYFIHKAGFTDFFEFDASLSYNIGLILLVGLSVVVFMFAIGYFIAMRTSAFEISITLNGSYGLSPRGVRIRNVLVGMQFFTAALLIILTFFIKTQNDYLMNHSWGFEKENILYLPYWEIGTDPETFFNELKTNSDILDYTLSAGKPGKLGWSFPDRVFEGRKIDLLHIWIVSANFFDFFGVDMVAGDPHIPEEVSKSKMYVNQEFVRKYELDENIIGKEIVAHPDNADIVGIVKDVNFESLHNPINPMAFLLTPGKSEYIYYYIKISGKNVPATLEHIKKTWSKFSSSEYFNAVFIDTEMNSLYIKENNLAKIITVFSIITILIAVMGVYGLVVLNSRYKVKEIGIRKVNGATIMSIMILLNRNMFVISFISFIVAVPIAYWVVTRWLEQFAYKIPVYWWLFAVAYFILIAIAFLIVSLQSYRAAKSNPVDALKTE